MRACREQYCRLLNVAERLAMVSIKMRVFGKAGEGLVQDVPGVQARDGVRAKAAPIGPPWPHDSHQFCRLPAHLTAPRGAAAAPVAWTHARAAASLICTSITRVPRGAAWGAIDSPPDRAAAGTRRTHRTGLARRRARQDRGAGAQGSVCDRDPGTPLPGLSSCTPEWPAARQGGRRSDGRLSLLPPVPAPGGAATRRAARNGEATVPQAHGAIRPRAVPGATSAGRQSQWHGGLFTGRGRGAGVIMLALETRRRGAGRLHPPACRRCPGRAQGNAARLAGGVASDAAQSGHSCDRSHRERGPRATSLPMLARPPRRHGRHGRGSTLVLR